MGSSTDEFPSLDKSINLSDPQFLHLGQGVEPRVNLVEEFPQNQLATLEALSMVRVGVGYVICAVFQLLPRRH